MEFDYKFYLSAYPDLIINNINTESQAYQHYVDFGKQENRIYSKIFFYKKYPKFNCNFYKSLYNDLENKSEEELIAHYISYGKKENRLINKKQLTTINNKNLYELAKNIDIQKQQWKKVLFNILIRTSNRKSLFISSLKMIRKQTHDNYNIIVSFDDNSTFEYVKNINNITLMDCRDLKTDKPFHWNEYCNRLLKKVDNGFVIFLDDDDIFTTKYVLEIINRNITSLNNFVYWKYYRQDRIIYSKNINKIPEYNNITSCGYTFNIKYIKKSLWQIKRGGDFDFVNDLFNYNKIFIKIFIDHILTKKNG